MPDAPDQPEQSDPAPHERKLSLVVAPEEANQRLDRWLVARVPELGRRRAAELFAAGRVRRGRRLLKKSELSRAGDTIDVELWEPANAKPEPLAPLHVRLETTELVVVSKPAGQATVPVPGSTEHTLASALLARYPEMASVGYAAHEPGVLHRLDTGTSGLVLAARNQRAFTHLRDELKAGRIHKRYLAIVESPGLPGGGVIDTELAPHPRDRRRMHVVRRATERGARPAETSWRVLERNDRHALVEVEVERALRHQIRVHLASIGHPIVGDALYGGAAAPGFEARHALHASHLGWDGDALLAGFAVDEPLPSEMRELMNGR